MVKLAKSYIYVQTCMYRYVFLAQPNISVSAGKVRVNLNSFSKINQISNRSSGACRQARVSKAAAKITVKNITRAFYDN